MSDSKNFSRLGERRRAETRGTGLPRAGARHVTCQSVAINAIGDEDEKQRDLGSGSTEKHRCFAEPGQVCNLLERGRARDGAHCGERRRGRV